MQRAAKAGSEVDAHFNVRVHPGKVAAFATTAAARRALSEFSNDLGTVTDSFRLLGVYYTMKRGRVAPDNGELSNLVQVRCERVAKACRHLKMRAMILRSVVVSALTWAACWQQHRAHTRQRWQSHIEKALWAGKVPSRRSRLLSRTVIGGPMLDLEFAAAVVLLRVEWNRRALQLQNVPVQPAPRGWNKLCEKWGWSEGPDLQLSTLLGLYSPRWHTIGSLLLAAEHAWQQDLWNQETRTAFEGPLGRRALVLCEHKNVAGLSNRMAFRAATAAAIDGAFLQYMGVPSPCDCGVQAPSAEHLIFHCSGAPPELMQGRSLAERKLLLLAIPFDRVPGNMDVAFDDELLQVLRGASQRDETILCATDGGCLINPGMERWQRGAWAVVVKVGAVETVISGLLPGPEQTPAAAERMALAVLGVHVEGTGVHGHVFSDNDAAIRRLRRSWGGDFSGPLAVFWQRVAHGLRGLDASWVPSHGKCPAWQAPAGCDSREVRRLNSIADAACSRQLKGIERQWWHDVAAYQAASAWTKTPLLRLMDVSKPFTDRAVEHYGRFRAQAAL